MHFIMICILLKYRVYTSLKSNIRAFANEFLMLVGVSMFYGIVKDDQENEGWKLDYTWGIIALFCLIIILNGLYLFTEIIIVPFLFKEGFSKSTKV